GDTSKSFSVPIIDDSYNEGNETFRVGLTDSSGTALGTPATITIVDNDTVTGPNPIDTSNFFMRIQYLEFLNREPEPAGLQYYLDILSGCHAGDAECLRFTRGMISANFFRSPEFQQKGSF